MNFVPFKYINLDIPYSSSHFAPSSLPIILHLLYPLYPIHLFYGECPSSRMIPFIFCSRDLFWGTSLRSSSSSCLLQRWYCGVVSVAVHDYRHDHPKNPNKRSTQTKPRRDHRHEAITVVRNGHLRLQPR